MLYAASLPKIAILLTLFESLEHGTLDWNDAFRWKLQKMINISDNAQATWAAEQVGLPAIATVMRDPRYCFYEDGVGGLWAGRGFAGIRASCCNLASRAPRADRALCDARAQRARFPPEPLMRPDGAPSTSTSSWRARRRWASSSGAQERHLATFHPTAPAQHATCATLAALADHPTARACCAASPGWPTTSFEAPPRGRAHPAPGRQAMKLAAWIGVALVGCAAQAADPATPRTLEECY
jgi:hypothetical protein